MTDKTPDRVLATTGLYPRFVGDWSEGEWLPVHPEEQVACYRVEYVRADLHAAVVAERDQLKAALKRQGDNLAFVLNRVSLPEAWFEKFDRELQEDRKALEKNDG